MIRLFLGLLITAFVTNIGLAQEPRKYRVGVLMPHSQDRSTARLDALRNGLREHGLSEEKLEIKALFGDGDPKRLLPLAKQLVEASVDVIVASSTLAVDAARKSTSEIPIIFAIAADPVESGFVQSLDRPGGNITGVPDSGQMLTGKRLEILKRAYPSINRVAVIGNAYVPQQAVAKKSLEDLSNRLAVEIVFFPEIQGPKDVEGALAAAAEKSVDALFTLAQGLTGTEQHRIIAASQRQRVPLMFHNREGVEGGALMMLGDDHAAIFRKAAGYVAKVLGGASPATLPVETAGQLEFLVNVKAARELGLMPTDSVLAEADGLVER